VVGLSITKIKKRLLLSLSAEKYKIGEYLAKLQARRWLSISQFPVSHGSTEALVRNLGDVEKLSIFSLLTWATAHRGKLGQLTPWKTDEKLKSENMRNRAVFYVFVIFSEQSGKAGVENGARLATYLFRYTSECTISWSNFQNCLRLRQQEGNDPLTKILRTFLIAYFLSTVIFLPKIIKIASYL